MWKIYSHVYGDEKFTSRISAQTLVVLPKKIQTSKELIFWCLCHNEKVAHGSLWKNDNKFFIFTHTDWKADCVLQQANA